MKKNIYLSLILSCGMIALGTTTRAPREEINEVLRRKVENMSIMPMAIGKEQIHCTEALPRFYEAKEFNSIWVSEREMKLFVAELRKAKHQGLNPLDYHIEAIERLIDKGGETATDAAQLELLLTDAFLLYSSHLINGKVSPTSTDPNWHVMVIEKDPVLVLMNASNGTNMAEALNNLIPKSKAYRSLTKALTEYERIAAAGGWNTVDAGPTLKPETKDQRIEQVRNRLLASKDLKAGTTDDPTYYDEELKAAVVAFQKRHGLEADGAIGERSVIAMNISAAERVSQIKANLERWRWIDLNMAEYYVLVNIPDYKLEVVRGGIIEKQHNVMVGKPVRKTPVFSSTMTYMVLNPTWTVPPTILSKDVIPAARSNPNYLAGKNIQIIDASGKTVDPSSVDWNSPSAKSYTYRQPAGKNNALGAVKFMFPNPYSIYLHDTPSKELFAKAERAFSSGCIRVEKPLELAAHLLADVPGWDPAKIQQVVNTGQTQTVNLASKPEVYILYWTAWADDAGTVQFRTDIYERDQALIDALKVEDPTADML